MVVVEGENVLRLVNLSRGNCSGGYVSGELSDSLLNGARSHWLKVNNVCATAIQWRTQRVHVVVHVHPKS